MLHFQNHKNDSLIIFSNYDSEQSERHHVPELSNNSHTDLCMIFRMAEEDISDKILSKIFSTVGIGTSCMEDLADISEFTQCSIGKYKLETEYDVSRFFLLLKIDSFILND